MKKAKSSFNKAEIKFGKANVKHLKSQRKFLTNYGKLKEKNLSKYLTNQEKIINQIMIV